MFFIADIPDCQFQIDAEETKHITKVLRKTVGDTIEITNGQGILYSARIIAIDKRECTVAVIGSQTFPNVAPQLTMAVAPTKNIDRFEWFVEKAVEIGVRRIIPLICDHSERTVLKRDRLLKIAVSAMKQSQSCHLPILSDLTSFTDCAANLTGDKLFAYCPTEQTAYITKSLRPNVPTTVFIGPEGDFSEREFKFACQTSMTPVSLGPSRLRTETAAVHVCSLVQSVWQSSLINDK